MCYHKIIIHIVIIPTYWLYMFWTMKYLNKNTVSRKSSLGDLRPPTSSSYYVRSKPPLPNLQFLQMLLVSLQFCWLYITLLFLKCKSKQNNFGQTTINIYYFFLKMKGKNELMSLFQWEQQRTWGNKTCQLLLCEFT